MTRRLRLHATCAAIAFACSLPWMVATQETQGAVAIDADDIGGVVTGTPGPEAGVWVIAETTDLPTKFARIVVTDDQGRYVLPDMPRATYNVWVRGYGLVDSPRVLGVPGTGLDLTAVVAPTPQAAAQYYPPNYLLVVGDEASGRTWSAAGGGHRPMRSGLPPDGWKGDTGNLSGDDRHVGTVRIDGRRVAATRPVGPERRHDVGVLRTDRPDALPGLDRCHPGRRCPEAAASATRRRAEPRGQRVGLGRGQRFRP